MRTPARRSRVLRLGLLAVVMWLGMAAVTAAVFHPWQGWATLASRTTISLVLVAVPLGILLPLIRPIIRGFLHARRERRRGGRFECLKCGYPLKGVPPDGPCPECGEPLGWIR